MRRVIPHRQDSVWRAPVGHAAQKVKKAPKPVTMGKVIDLSNRGAESNNPRYAGKASLDELLGEIKQEQAEIDLHNEVQERIALGADSAIANAVLEEQKLASAVLQKYRDDNDLLRSGGVPLESEKDFTQLLKRGDVPGHQGVPLPYVIRDPQSGLEKRVHLKRDVEGDLVGLPDGDTALVTHLTNRGGVNAIALPRSMMRGHDRANEYLSEQGIRLAGVSDVKLNNTDNFYAPDLLVQGNPFDVKTRMSVHGDNIPVQAYTKLIGAPGVDLRRAIKAEAVKRNLNLIETVDGMKMDGRIRGGRDFNEGTLLKGEAIGQVMPNISSYPRKVYQSVSLSRGRDKMLAEAAPRSLDGIDWVEYGAGVDDYVNNLRGSALSRPESVIMKPNRGNDGSGANRIQAQVNVPYKESGALDLMNTRGSLASQLGHDMPVDIERVIPVSW